MFPHLDYLEWIEGRPPVAMHDLGSSDLRGDRDHGAVVVPPSLRDRHDPPAGATLELQVASAYGVDPERVVVTAGASMANVIAAATALTLAAEGAERVDAHRVLVESPGYDPLVGTPAGFGATVDRFDREADGTLDPAAIEAAVDDATALVSVTNRHNPTGRLATGDALAGAATAARSADARLLVDEVYAPCVTDPDPGGAFGGVTAAGLEGAVVTGSLTKFFGLGDLRVGWLVADEPFAARAREVAHHFPSLAGPSRALGQRALHHADALAADARDLLETNADLLAEFVAARDDLEGAVPAGSSFAFLDPVAASGDEVAAAAWDAGVLVVPGRFFDDPARIRVSLGRSPEDARAALRAFGGVLDGLAGENATD